MSFALSPLVHHLQTKTYPNMLLQRNQVKVCGGCQIKELGVKKWVGPNHVRLKTALNLSSYKYRLDLQDVHLERHAFDISHRIGIFAKHIPNHEGCYNYELKTVDHLIEFSDLEPDPIDRESSHTVICPGHEYLQDVYFIYNAAVNTGIEHTNTIRKRANIKKVDFSVIEKNSEAAKGKKYFEGIKGVHKYAVVIKYYHEDYSALCPSHPYHKKDIGPYPVFGAVGKEVVSIQTN